MLVVTVVVALSVVKLVTWLGIAVKKVEKPALALIVGSLAILLESALKLLDESEWSSNRLQILQRKQKKGGIVYNSFFLHLLTVIAFWFTIFLFYEQVYEL